MDIVLVLYGYSTGTYGYSTDTGYTPGTRYSTDTMWI